MTRIDTVKTEEGALVAPRGPLDAETGPLLEDALRALLDDERPVTIDLSMTPWVSSAGVATWAPLLPALVERSALKIVGLQGQPRRFLDLAGVLRLLDLQERLRKPPTDRG